MFEYLKKKTFIIKNKNIIKMNYIKQHVIRMKHKKYLKNKK